MRIKSLELIGFKSFYEKTVIQFNSGINAVVGPNGCGKSNILDAIRWALGEQNPRRLRADGMEEVIGHGGESLKPLGMAEATLVITDVPKNNFDEVVIKRRLFRSAESEYYINGTPCRLKDITEMFIDTGIGARAYSNINQGKIEHLITTKPEERRSLVEEVAGILKYKTRRRETESRIESTRENLRRVRDVINEVNRQMHTLNRQAKDAEEFKGLSEEAKNLELKILHSKLRELQRERRTLSDEKSETESAIHRLEERIRGKEAIFSAFESKAVLLEQKLGDLEKETYKIKSDLQANESLQELVRNETSSSDEFIEKLERENKLLREEKWKIETQTNNKRSDLEKVGIDLSSKEAQVKEREEALFNLKEEGTRIRTELEATRKMVFETLDKSSSLKGIAFGYEKELNELKSRRERIKKEIEDVEREKEKTCSLILELELALKNIQERRSQIEEKKKSTELSLSELNINQELKNKENTVLGERLKEVHSRLNVLRQIQSNYEWLPEKIRRFILQKKGNGILGLVADFISVPKGYEKAIEAAFGDKLQWALVIESEEALSAIESLRELSIGRGTFIPVTSTRKNGDFKKNGKDILPLWEIIKVEGTDSAVIENMLKGVFVVPSIREALGLREEMEEGTAFVTPDGDLLDSTGAISGGFAQEGVLGRKREIEELSAESSTLEEEISRISKEMELNQAAIEKLKSRVEELEKESVESEIKDAEVKKDITNLRDNLLRTERRYEIIEFDLNGFHSEIEEKETNLTEIRTMLERLQEEKAALELRFQQLEGKVQKSEDDERSLENEITNLRVENATLIEKEKGIKEDLDELEKRRKEIEEKIELETIEIDRKKEEKQNLIKTDEDASNEVKNLLGVLIEKEEELSLAENQKNDLRHEIKTVQEEREKLRQEVNSAKEKLNAFGLQLNSINIEIEHIEEAIRRSGFDLNQVDSETPEDFSFDSEQDAKLKKLKERIEKFGPVNLLAPEEYKNLEERQKFLSEQMDDLENALSSLRKAINKIDKESEKRFIETFEVINKKFQDIFSRLFRGGEAKLILTNPEDMLQTGVEVMVRPTGKRFQSVNLLSGGEKTLSAIALIISACFVKPTPFLLFDEIDAPLDDANTSQFVDLLKDIAKESQVILITHNKKTMQAVNALIGITSDKPGVSKVVSVELRGS
ncbi:MAG: chromosome segregation protein SMC [Deltaproteobacteria bacterium]|nr:chromosome segregation protein SMC [Deltaproteobacteria bacterium]